MYVVASGMGGGTGEGRGMSRKFYTHNIILTRWARKKNYKNLNYGILIPIHNTP